MTVTNAYGSLDVTLTFVPSTSITVLVETDIQAIAAFQTEQTGYGDLDIRLGYKDESSKHYIVCNTEIDGVVVDTADYELEPGEVSSLDVRVFIHNKCVSIYANERWVYSYSFGYVNYAADSTIIASLSVHGGSLEITNINRHELSDWREAVFVDYEANSQSVIQSIVQQRPLEIYPETDNGIVFTYHAIGDTVVPGFIKTLEETEQTPSDVSSDGLVYAADIGISLYEDAAAEVGLITRLYRLSELDSGIIHAAKILQEKALERRHPITIEMRLDPRIEYCDLLDMDLVVSGTKTVLSKEVIVESISPTLENGRYRMTVSGRRNIT
jgi:hypothetical protein